MSWKRWTFILTSVLIVLYIYSYYQIPKNLTVLQASLSQFHFDMLREKQPIVIHDRLPTMDTLESYWFSANRTQSLTYTKEQHGYWQKNRYKYMVLHPQQDCEIMVVLGNAQLADDGTPHPDTSTPVVLKMQAHQVVILPYRSYWMMATPCEYIHTLGVHDYVTYLLP